MKRFIIKLEGELEKRMNEELEKDIFNQTDIVRMALADFFEKLNDENLKLKDIKNNKIRNGNE